MLLQDKNLGNKRGISVIIGYVLLIAVVIAISVLVYQWLKSYVPRDALSCPDGVAISMPDFVYNCSFNTTHEQLNFTVDNSGTFSIAGYLIHVTNTSTQQLATIDLSKYYFNATNRGYYSRNSGAVLFGTFYTLNYFSPSTSFTINDSSFLIPKAVGTLNIVEITPVRYVNYSGQTRTAVCGNARITQTVECS